VKLKFREEYLHRHSDQEFADLVLGGLQGGFRIGFQRDRIKLRSAKRNMSSAGKQQEVVSSYLDKELKADRIALVGSQEEAQDVGIHMSPFGVIPKKGKANKWRLIQDLSSPTGQSVNNGISKEQCSLQYTSVGLVATKIVELGKGTLMGKNGYPASLLKHSSGARGQTSPWREMRGEGVCRQGLAIWSEISSNNFHCGS